MKENRGEIIMKKIIVLTLAGALMVSGCQANLEKPAPTDATDNEVVTTSTLREDIAALNYEVVNPNMFMDNGIIDRLEGLKTEEGYFVFEYDGGQYIAVFAGERNSGGYDIEVDAITMEDGKIIVSTLETAPGPDMMVTMALTYPMTVVKLMDFEPVDNLEFEVIFSSSIGEGNDKGYFVSETNDRAVGEIVTVGEIMEFDKKYVHIIGGDLVQVYKYDGNESDFYLGQTVQLVKGENEDYLENFEKDNYTVSHSNMGHMIEQIKGELIEINEESIIIEAEGEKVEVNMYQEMFMPEGTDVTVYAMIFGEHDKSAVMVISEESMLTLEVAELTRDSSGVLDALLKDKDGGEYVMSLSGVTCEFDISKVVEGDVLKVYHNGIMESWPMQINTVLVRK